MSSIINASTSSGLVQTADTSGTLELQSNGTTQLTVSSTGTYGQLKSGTAQASTSGTSIDFTGIPSWVKRITVMFSGVSTNGTSYYLVQIGDSGGIEATGYGSLGDNGGAAQQSTVGFNIITGAANWSVSGAMTINLLSGTTYVSHHVFGTSTGSAYCMRGGGTKTLTDVLDRVRITTVNGTDTFDAGSINILYEG